MGQILAQETPDMNWKAIAKKDGIELSDQMIDTMESVRTIFDAYGKRFGIPMSDWITNYNSRISKLSNQDFKTAINRDVMEEALGSKAPNKIEAFFSHTRTEDYVQGKFEDNIESILDTYLRVGLRKEIMGDTIVASKEFINT